VIDFDEKTVTRILIDEFDFNTVEAKLLAEGLPNLHPDLHNSLNDYLEQRIERNIEFLGISTSQIMEKSRCNYINALVTMNVFFNDPTLIEEYKAIPPEHHRRACGGFKPNE
jgi:hypothetical protein